MNKIWEKKHLHCSAVTAALSFRSVVPLVESVRTQESQSPVNCVLAPRKKEIMSSDKPQRPGIWEKERHC